MKLRLARTGVILGSLVALAVGGCASSSKSATMGTGDLVAERQRLMKNVGANWADIQAKVKAGAPDTVAVNAESLSLHAQRIPGLFPPRLADRQVEGEAGHLAKVARVRGRREESREPLRHIA